MFTCDVVLTDNFEHNWTLDSFDSSFWLVHLLGGPGSEWLKYECPPQWERRGGNDDAKSINRTEGSHLARSWPPHCERAALIIRENYTDHSVVNRVTGPRRKQFQFQGLLCWENTRFYIPSPALHFGTRRVLKIPVTNLPHGKTEPLDASL
jgi:hypothetical protein